MPRTTSTLSLVLAATLSNALVNVTVDDADEGSSIYFTSQNCVALKPDDAGGTWEVSPGRFVNSCHNKTLRRCDEVGATATFSFTGVAVYLIYPPWPHEMTVSATLDSNAPIFITIPARSEGVETDASSVPVWGHSGLPNTEHTLTIGRQDPGGGVYVDAFMYTALCNTTPCARRRGGGGDDSDSPVESDSAPESSSTSTVSTMTPSSSSIPSSSIPSSSIPSQTPPPTTSPPTTPPPTTSISLNANQHRDTLAVALGTVLGVLILAIIISFFGYRHYRRRSPAPTYEEKPSPPYTASYISTSEPTRPPSMRERRDRFSDTQTPAGTALTRTPASMLTSLSSNSMGLVHLSSIPTKDPSSSVHSTSIQDDEPEAGLEIPPPEYETPRTGG